MTDRSKQHPNDETVAKWVREMGVVAPDPAFRDRLRSAFVSGQIDADASAAARPAARPSPAAAPRRWWSWAIPAVAAAAAVVVVFVMNGAPALEVVATSGSGTVHVNGQAMELADAASIAEAVRGGASVEVPAGASLDLAVDGTVLYEVTGGTRVVLPEAPGRWFSRAVACSVTAGELRIKTGPRFPGSELAVYTPEGMVVVTGTLLSVQCDESGTCVCVLEGVARVGVDEADLQPVSPGFRKIMMRDGTRDIIPVKDMHRDGVIDFDRRVGNQME